MTNKPTPNHVMIDLETMGTTPDSAIVSVGAVIFDPRTSLIGKEGTDKVFYRELDWDFQGRYISPSTEIWWRSQSEQARSALNGMDELDVVLQELANWLPKDAKVWGNGSIFDIAMLEDAYRQHDIDIPWKFWNVRDCRTIKDLYESSRGGWGKSMGVGAHNSLQDALYQAQYISSMWNKILSPKQ